jgi:hypothetical protein
VPRAGKIKVTNEELNLYQVFFHGPASTCKLSTFSSVEVSAFAKGFNAAAIGNISSKAKLNANI